MLSLTSDAIGRYVGSSSVADRGLERHFVRRGRTLSALGKYLVTAVTCLALLQPPNNDVDSEVVWSQATFQSFVLWIENFDTYWTLDALQMPTPPARKASTVLGDVRAWKACPRCARTLSARLISGQELQPQRMRSDLSIDSAVDLQGSFVPAGARGSR